MSRRRASLLWALMAGASAVHAADADPNTVRTIEPRAYGYVVGDLVERRAQLPQPLAPSALPRRGRVDAWLELREVELGGTAPQELRLVYQIVNVPKQVATIELPALRLPAAQGALDIDAWPITVSAMTPAYALARAGLDEMQPDIAPQRAPVAPLITRIALALLAMAVVLYALALTRWPQLAFWRREAPFRRAWLDLRRLAQDAATATDGGDAAAATRRAMSRLHAAFDAAAGQALFAERLEPLFAAQPRLQPLAGEIERFYAQSRGTFFAAQPPSPGVALTQLIDLARRLAQAEAAA